MKRVQPIERLWQTVRDALAALGGEPSLRRRSLIVVAAVLVCAYAAGVIWYVLSVPEIGIRCAFTTRVDRFFPEFLYPPEGQPRLQPDDAIVQVGARRVENWPQLLRHMVNLRQRTSPEVVTERAALDDPRRTHALLDGQEIIRVQAQRQEKDGTVRDLTVWCRLGRSPWETLLPTVLWFFIKAGLFLVGALVFWKRPGERSARVFFLLCIVSCGAYLGGYHWQGIATQPALLLVFMVCSVLLPPVSLHFYLLFPRPKLLFERRPRTTLALLYGPPLAFLGLMLLVYRDIRRLRMGGSGEDMQQALEEMLHLIYCYFAIALVWYLLSIWCLIHSYRTAQNGTERNQVKWILYGAVAALAPLGFSLYLALFEKDKFGGGDAAWPMFCASLFVTVAFTISITRYRLMQLDQLVSSGAVYFAVSVLAVVVYYGLVFAGVLLLGSRIAPGPFGQALGVSAIVLGLMAVLNLARGRLKKALDRHFRREKYQLERTLQRMSEAVGQLVDPPTLARRFLQTTTDLLGVERGAVYLREGAPPLFRVTDTVGPAPPLNELPPGCPLVEELLAHGSLSVRPPPGNGTPAEPKAALRQLQFLGGEVALALTHEGRMLALLVLGPRSARDLAGGPFTGEDLNVLSAFAQITVLALVSGEGGRTIEALNRELQTKVEKIAEQQRRILALQTQLTRRQRVEVDAVPSEEPAANGEAADNGTAAAAARPTAAEPAPGDIVGSGPAVRQLLQLVRKVAGADAAVLLRGESGTGKELLARAVHDNSPRSRRPFVRVHCAALHANLLESELFGHVKGAFTGAVRDRPGRFELAHGGTLFLDEIGDVSWEVQTKLLRVIQEKTFERVGSSEPIEVDVRIIAATHRNLEKLIRQERFREDLFYRLNVFPVQVPPLRERREDIPELVQHFLRCYGQRCGKRDVQLDDDALATLKAAPWPGNVRQLENAIARAVVIAEGTVLTVADLSTDLLVPRAEEEEESGSAEEPVVVAAAASAGGGVRVERADRDRREREQLVRALASTQGNKAEAARALGLARSTLVSRLKKHGLS